jgi:hypothetical protein
MPSDSRVARDRYESRLWPPDPLSMRQMHAGRVHPLRLRLRLRVYQKSRRCATGGTSGARAGAGGARRERLSHTHTLEVQPPPSPFQGSLFRKAQKFNRKLIPLPFIHTIPMQEVVEFRRPQW